MRGTQTFSARARRRQKEILADLSKPYNLGNMLLASHLAKMEIRVEDIRKRLDEIEARLGKKR